MDSPTFESPHRIKPEDWRTLCDALGIRDTVARRVARPRSSGRGRRGEADSNAPPPEAGAWAILLHNQGRLGMDLGDGKRAVLCPWDHEHSQPDGDAAGARGGTVLYPPREGSNMGLPHCSHAHCQSRAMREWIMECGVDGFANALAEARGWRQAGGFLLWDGGITRGRKVPLRLKGGGETVSVEPVEGEAAEKAEPYAWAPETFLGKDGPLCDFPVRIVADVEVHTGSTSQRSYELAGAVSGRPFTMRVPAAEFQSLGWVSKLGGEAVISPGSTTKDVLRYAIQVLSKPIARRDAFAQTGWRHVRGEWMYLHAGGGITRDGERDGVDMQLADDFSRRFELPEAATGEALKDAIRGCRALFRAYASITYPLFGLVWRAPIGPSTTLPFIVGEQQTGKSFLCALAQAHFGAAMHDSKKFPGSYMHDSAGALIRKVLTIRDAIAVVDDLVLHGTAGDIDITQKADLLARSVFNGAAPGRLERSGGKLQESDGAPGCLVVSTGEGLPRGASLRSRYLVLELPEKLNKVIDLKVERRLAAEGVYASAMAAYVQWLAPRLDTIRAEMPAEVAKIVDRLDGVPPRTAEQLADVAIGIKHFLAFALAHGAVTEAEADETRREAWAAMLGCVKAQGVTQAAQDPVRRFVDLLGELFASGRGYLTTSDGTAPENAHLWGWRTVSNIDPSGAPDDGAPPIPKMTTGLVKLGMLIGDRLYIHANMAHAEVCDLAKRQGDPLAITREDIGKRLHEKGLLAADELKARQTFTVRKKISGKVVPGLLCLAWSVFEGGGPKPVAAVEPVNEAAVSVDADTDKPN